MRAAPRWLGEGSAYSVSCCSLIECQARPLAHRRPADCVVSAFNFLKFVCLLFSFGLRLRSQCCRYVVSGGLHVRLLCAHVNLGLYLIHSVHSDQQI